MHKPPSYRKKSGRSIAIVALVDAHTGQRREYPLGQHNSPESREAYYLLIAQWEADGRRLPEINDGQRGGKTAATIDDICFEYWQHIKGHSTPEELMKTRSMIRVICQYHGSQPAAEFGPRSLSDLIKPMADGDLNTDPPRKPWKRIYINQQLGRIKRMFKWAVARELVPASSHHGLIAVENVRKGTTGVGEGEKVRPVDLDRVEKTKPFLSNQIQALIEMQIHTGARAGELLIMRPMDLDRSGEVWIYTPTKHKLEHAGKNRTIPIGPKSQRVIIQFLQRDQDQFIFSPAEAELARLGVLPTGAHSPGDHYTIQTYGRAISRACRSAFPFPLCMKLEHRDEWHRSSRWTPHQLRHTAATMIRAKYGLEAAQLMLGHSSAVITDAVYAERDQSKVIAIARDVG